MENNEYAIKIDDSNKVVAMKGKCIGNKGFRQQIKSIKEDILLSNLDRNVFVDVCNETDIPYFQDQIILEDLRK